MALGPAKNPKGYDGNGRKDLSIIWIISQIFSEFRNKCATLNGGMAIRMSNEVYLKHKGLKVRLPYRLAKVHRLLSWHMFIRKLVIRKYVPFNLKTQLLLQ